MINMSYVRVENTLKALKECSEGRFDMFEQGELVPAEAKAMVRLINFCKRIGSDYDDGEAEEILADVYNL